MRKNLLIITFGLLTCIQGIGQQEPLYAQYRTQAFLINPAIAGSGEQAEIRLSYRGQWIRFPGAPQTFAVSMQGVIDPKNALGFLAFNDRLGPSTRNGLQLSYAFHIPIGDLGDRFSMGLGLKAVQYRFDVDRVYFQDPNDQTVLEAATPYFAGDVALGFYYYNQNFYLGFSSPNLIQADGGNNSTSQQLLSRLYRHYFAFMGYKFRYESLTLEPSVLLKKVDYTPFQVEGTVRFHFLYDRIMVGAGYRSDWMASLMFGIRTRNLQFVYSADFKTGPFNPESRIYGLSNEISLGIDIGADPWSGN